MRKLPHWSEVLTLGVFVVVLVWVRATKATDFSILSALAIASVAHAVLLLFSLLETKRYVRISGSLVSFDPYETGSPKPLSHWSRFSICYSYTVDGQVYQSNRVTLRPWSFRSMAGDNDLRSVLRVGTPHPSGTLPIFVNRSNTSKAVLTLKFDWVVFAFFITVSAMLFFARILVA
jgi:hypothetical protein